jgi:hypothetical protein
MEQPDYKQLYEEQLEKMEQLKLDQNLARARSNQGVDVIQRRKMGVN